MEQKQIKSILYVLLEMPGVDTLPGPFCRKSACKRQRSDLQQHLERLHANAERRQAPGVMGRASEQRPFNVQVEEQECNLLEMEEKLSMLDATLLEARLQGARSNLQQHVEKLQALQAEAAAQRRQQQQQRKQLQSLHSSKQQAQVPPTQNTKTMAVHFLSIQCTRAYIEPVPCVFVFSPYPAKRPRAAL